MPMRQVAKLVRVVARLRSKRGCPWDRKQTLASLVPYLREESAELARALQGGRRHEIEDELGDLLFHVTLHSQIASERGWFDLEDVAKSQALKLMRRHPHVFGSRRFKTAAEVVRHWPTIKAAERKLRERDLAARRLGRRRRAANEREDK